MAYRNTSQSVVTWLIVVAAITLSLAGLGVAAVGASDSLQVQNSVTVNEQNTTGDVLGVANASAEEPFVAVASADGETMGVSDEFEEGVDGFPIDLDTEITEDTTVEVTLHEPPADDNDSFGDPLTEDGVAVSDTANVTHIEASVEIADQESDGTSLVINQSTYSEGSWGIHVHRFAGEMGEILGTTEEFEAGATAQEVELDLDEPITETQTMMAMLHYGGEEVTGEDDFITYADGEASVADLGFIEVDPVDRYRNDEGEIGLTGLRDAIADWRSGDLGLTALSDVVDAWRNS